MTWSYRLIKHDLKENNYLAVHEIYYDERGEIEMWTKDPVSLSGDSKADILKDLKVIMTDLKQPMLKETELIKQLNKAKKRN